MRAHEIHHGVFALRAPFRRNGIIVYRIRRLDTRALVQVSTQARDKKVARQFIIDWMEREAAVALKREARILFSQAIVEWRDLKALRESTLRDLERSIAKVYIPAFGDRPVDLIALRDVERFVADLNFRGRAPRTVQKHVTALRSFFRWGIRRGYCDADPTEGIKVRRPARKVGRVLTLEQARALLSAASSDRKVLHKYRRRAAAVQCEAPPRHLFLALLISLHTGLRRGNVLGLEWFGVDFAGGRISIQAEDFKSNADHVLPMHHELAEVLRAEMARLKKAGPVSLRAPVIGARVKEIKRSFHSALKRAGLPHLRWHDLRHTFASWIGRRATYAVVKALLGHSPGSVTDLYLHATMEEMASAIQSLPRLLTTPAAAGERGA